ncbi:hypothetical protein Dimus_035447, partial [Dionaea muscipula]
GGRLATGIGTCTVSLTPALADATGLRGLRLSDEEWDIIRQFRARGADAYARDVEILEQEDVSEEDEVRHPQRVDPIPERVPWRALMAPVLAMVAHDDEDFRLRWFDRFLRVGPLTFTASCTDPVEASNWLMGIERVLRRIGCLLEQRVLLASFQLRELAEFWWMRYDRRFEAYPEELT